MMIVDTLVALSGANADHVSISAKRMQPSMA